MITKGTGNGRENALVLRVQMVTVNSGDLCWGKLGKKGVAKYLEKTARIDMRVGVPLK